ncbi:hypothetical protein AIN02nite_29150 [Acetobacter indonesiensis]|uniref:Uncharacterized protein n=1 Tax=Acetobacter indonesiensis TaxID=104101 RepID=A0A6N3T9D0_9PROT|nr:hypothetical protein AIN02nite_29150 [Acetobacter indonesiensis]
MSLRQRTRVFGYEATPAPADGRDSKAKNQFTDISLFCGYESIGRGKGAKSIISTPECSRQTIGKCVFRTGQKGKIIQIQWWG